MGKGKGVYDWLMGKKKSTDVAKSDDGILAISDLSGGTLTKEQDDFLWALAEGIPHTKLAVKLATKEARKAGRTDDEKYIKKRAKHWRKYAYRLLKQVHIQEEIAARLKLMTMLGVGPAIKAVNRKAAAGRVDAIKLVFESSGFHNPRIQHEHGGQVEITIRNAPRPERVEEEYIGNRDLDKVIDAQVVE